MEAKKYLPVIKQTPPEPLGERPPTSPPTPADDEGCEEPETLGSTDRLSSNLTGKRGPHLVFCFVKGVRNFYVKVTKFVGLTKIRIFCPNMV